MEKTLELYEEYLETLNKINTDVANRLVAAIGEDPLEDASRRDFVRDVLNDASYLLACMSLTENRIKILKRNISKGEA